MVKVIFQPSGRRGEVEEGKTLREAANELGVGIEQVCGGNKVCGKCKVQVQEGYFSKFDMDSKAENLSPLIKEERNHLRDGEVEDNYRLACSASLEGDVLVFVPEESRVGGQVVRKAAGEIDIDIDPAVKKYYVELSKPTLEDPEGDVERLLRTVKEFHGMEGLRMDYQVLKSLPTVLREAKWKVTLSVLNESEIVNVEPGLNDRALGIAFDIGTTTVVGYLTDLRNGKVLAIDSMMNPQVGYGEDVMSRITYAMEHEDGLAKMHEAIITGINKIIGNLCEEAGIAREEILELTLVGNTAMHHICLNLYPEYLGLSPFTPAIHHSVDVKARDLKIEAAPGANLHLLPVEAGFVGADNMGVVMATEPQKKEKPWLIIDIGTNGEIVLGNKDKLLSTSCATGPAFEGAQINFGMRAAPGAIERVRIDPETKEPRYKVIGSEEWNSTGNLQESGSQLAWTKEKSMARGLCGSGIIEVVAEMFKAGIIKNSGVFNTELDTPRIRKDGKGQPEYVLAWADETAINQDITVNQADVRAIQLAKGALYTGCRILMKRYGIDSVGRVILAGAFGNYIDREASMVIGMFPDCKLEKVSAVGNAAGDGARIALLNRKKREEANRVARRIKYIELTVDPGFQEEFMQAMYFPHMKHKFPHVQEILDKIPR